MNWDVDGSYYARNTEYGRGVFRRAIGLTADGNEVVAEVEDTHHGFRVVVVHDGESVTGIRGIPLRIPTTGCGAAAAALRCLVGKRLTESLAPIYAAESTSHQCTHMFDLAALAIAHASRGSRHRRYDVEVPDEDDDGSAWCSVSRDGEPVHRWRIQHRLIAEPAEFSGQPMLSGFIRFMSGRFSGDDLEAALVLQKGFFVSRARKWRIDMADGRVIAPNQQMHDRCFAYQPESRQHARHVDSTRDFTHRSEDLLKFLP